MGLLIGLLSSIFAGVLNGSFAAPMKNIFKWEWENTWFIYALLAFLILPAITAFISVPDLFDVYSQVKNPVIILTFITGVLFGLGSVTFGLGLHLAGLSLGYSLMIGLISITGSLGPMLLLNPKSILTPGGLILILAMIVSLLGVIFFGVAGALRAKTQTGGVGERKASFKVAFAICAVSGIFSSMLNISLAIGLPIAEIAMTKVNGSLSSFRAYNAVWLVTLYGAFIPYFLYCVFLFRKNKSFRKYKVNKANFYRSASMGLLWFACIAIYGAGASQLGKMGTTIAWLVLMAVTSIIGNLWGLFSGEWEDATQKAKNKMKTGFVMLVLSIVLVAISKFYL